MDEPSGLNPFNVDNVDKEAGVTRRSDEAKYGKQMD
jgi:hypothetical protein